MATATDSPRPEGEDVPARRMSTDLDRLHEFVELMSRGEVDAAQKFISDDITIHEPYALPYGGEHHGLAGWETFRSIFRQTWRRWVDGPIWYAEANGTVVKENVITATSRRTNKSCTTRLAEFFTFRDGEIVECRIYYQDIPGVLAAITPDPAALPVGPVPGDTARPPAS